MYCGSILLLHSVNMLRNVISHIQTAIPTVSVKNKQGKVDEHHGSICCNTRLHILHPEPAVLHPEHSTYGDFTSGTSQMLN